MDINFPSDAIQFREELRSFVDEHFTESLRARLAPQEGEDFKAAYLTWQRLLRDHGYLTPNWPTDEGGPGWTSVQRYLFDSVMSEAGAPKGYSPNIDMIGPVLFTFGSPEQREQHLPGIRRCDQWWCQGYSEPGAGSDLASLTTRAVRDGDVYHLQGTKVWTTYAQFADWMFCLVRTSTEGKKQAGISFLLIDMTSPGITVNKISTIDGYHTLNEVRLDDVRVPVSNRIGEENKGWTYAKNLLTFERTTLARVSESRRYLRQIQALAEIDPGGARPMNESPAFRQRLAKAEIDLAALETLELRVLSSTAIGKAPGNESSILKLRGSEMRQRLQSMRMDLMAYHKAYLGGGITPDQIDHAHALEFTRNYMHGRAASILGGSSEVQRNIIAKSVLGI